LGKNIADFCREIVEKGQLDVLRERVDNLVLVEQSKPAPVSLTKKYAEFCDEKVASQQKTDWYCLLRNTQNGDNLPHILSGKLEHMIDGREFVQDSLFCEYAYVIDLNLNIFDVYKGFQHFPTEGNIFGTQPDENGYYPVKQIASYPLNDIPKDWVKQIEEMEKKEGEIGEALDQTAEEVGTTK
jgi:hypothetical protein